MQHLSGEREGQSEGTDQHFLTITLLFLFFLELEIGLLLYENKKASLDYTGHNQYHVHYMCSAVMYMYVKI